MSFMSRTIEQYLLNTRKDHFHRFGSREASALGKWHKRIATATVVVGLLMTGALAVAQPSNLGDDQVFQINNDLERATAELISANTSAEKHLDSTDAQYALAVAHERLGDLQMLRAGQNFPYSFGYNAAYKLAYNNKMANSSSNLIKIVERLESTSAKDSEDKLSAFRMRAWRHYDRAGVLYQRLVELQPNNNKWQHALAVNFIKNNRGYSESEESRIFFQPALAILLRLTKLEPGNYEFQRDLAMLYELIADKDYNDPIPAEYSDAYAIRLKLFRQDEKNPLFVRELAVTLGKITDAAWRRGKWKTARDAVTDEFSLYQDLAAMDPNNMEWQRALALAHMEIANIKNDNNAGKERKMLEGEVLVHYDEALKIRLHLIEVDPSNTEWQVDLVSSYATMANFYVQREQRDKALMLYIEAQQKMAQFAQRYPSDRGWLFYQIYFYSDIGYEHRKIQKWAAPHSKGGSLPNPEKFKAAAVAQKEVFKNMVESIDRLVRMTEAPIN
jgi:hypothetical protein